MSAMATCEKCGGSLAISLVVLTIACSARQAQSPTNSPPPEVPASVAPTPVAPTPVVKPVAIAECAPPIETGTQCLLTAKQYAWQLQHYDYSWMRLTPQGVCMAQQCVPKPVCAERCMLEAYPQLAKKISPASMDCRAEGNQDVAACREEPDGSSEQVAVRKLFERCMTSCSFHRIR